MNRLLLFMFFVLFASSDISAQTKSSGKIEVRLGAGFLTAPEIIEDITGGITESIVNPGYTKVDFSGTVAVMATVLLRPESRFSYGLDLVYDNIKATYIYPNPAQESRTNAGYFTVMARGDFKYLNKPSFSIYSSLAAGVTFRSADLLSDVNKITENDLGGAFHISPLGIRYGGKIALWAEAGFGFKGVLSGGLAVRL